MREPKHTKGPWWVERDLPGIAREVFATFNDRPCVVARVYSWEGNGTGMKEPELIELRRKRRETEEANARLVAAAPVMYQALTAFFALREDTEVTATQYIERNENVLALMQSALDLAEIG